MAIQFQSIKIKEPSLFGISMTGSVSRSDKAALEELAQQAMARKKVHLILDLSQLTSIGGSGARVLADFQRQLQDVQGEAVFSGAGTVVRRFLDGKFGELPLRYFLNVDDAVNNFYNEDYVAPDHSALSTVKTVDSAAKVENNLAQSIDNHDDVGAMSFYDDESEGDVDSGLDNLLHEFTGKNARKGRSKEHRYTSLAEAVSTLSTWHDGQNQQEFADALTNLLFSQGLADNVDLLFPSGIHLCNPEGENKIPLAGALARHLVNYARPLTILDIPAEELLESEASFLEEMNPEMILPLLNEQQLIGVVLLSNNGQDREYSVGENFAFELLMQVLSGASVVTEKTSDEQNSNPSKNLLEAASSVASVAKVEIPTDLNETLYHLALELPDADDRPHFWRIFWRNVKKIMPLDELAFLAPDGNRPQVMAGEGADWMALDLGQDRLKMYFRTMERPVQVCNLPSLFQEIKEKMMEAGVDWLVGLNWDDQYQGMVLLAGKLDEMEMFPEERLMQLFLPTARMLARFDSHNDDADITQSLVQTLMGEREIRCFGSDDVTFSMVEQLNLLAREMSFPPDQHRDLVYGCLLRDIGLVGQPDELMSAPANMTPEQLQVYYQHPERGRQLLAERDLPPTIVEVVSCHHERFNGQGYPEGLAGREIPLTARVVTVVENYVAMIRGIGYPEPLSAVEAAAQLRDDVGGRFDPDIVTVFLQAVLSGNKSKETIDEAAQEQTVVVEQEKTSSVKELHPV